MVMVPSLVVYWTTAQKQISQINQAVNFKISKNVSCNQLNHNLCP